MTPVVTGLRRTHPAFEVARLLQAAGPVSATFATPFIIRPDPDAAGSFDPRYFKRFTAHDLSDFRDLRDERPQRHQGQWRVLTRPVRVNS